MRLQDLITSQMAALGITQTDLIHRSAQTAWPVSRNTWWRWTSTNPGTWPEPDTMRGMAAALQVDVETVMAAAAESLHLPTHTVRIDPHAQAIISLTCEATAEQRELLVDVLRSLSRSLHRRDLREPDLREPG